MNIHIGEKTLYSQRNICFVMFEDCKIFVFNYVSKQTVAIYQPPVLSVDHAVGFTLHQSGNFFATASRAGLIVFWELN